MRVVYVVAFFMFAGEFASGNQERELNLEDHLRVNLEDRSDRGNELFTIKVGVRKKNHFY